LRYCGTVRKVGRKEEERVGQITFDEFRRMDLRVAEVLKAERVGGTQKLVKLEVDIGTEKRQVVAGVAEAYPPETLVGKRIIVVANLRPARIRGVESQGMLLAADLEGTPIIPFLGEDVPAGTKVR
jgi:methionine--tRNA ligase beta chain